MRTMMPRRKCRRVSDIGFLLFATVLCVAMVSSVEAVETDKKKPRENSEAPTEDESDASSEAESDENAEVAQAEDEDDKPAVKGKSKKERRRLRFERLVRSFAEDKRMVYDRHGFPSYRYRERGSGRVTEHWVYVSKELEFVFVGNRLIRTRRR